MVDGVDVNDNLFGTPNNLFIEDAIQETQVLTSGISAEYGRFSGGVINVVTKSGGNKFSGSVRVNLSNPSGSAKRRSSAPNGVEHTSQLGKTHEGDVRRPDSQGPPLVLRRGTLRRRPTRRTPSPRQASPTRAPTGTDAES